MKISTETRKLTNRKTPSSTKENIQIVRNLENKIPGAPNFRYKEFVRSSTALRLGINNIPEGREWIKIEELALHVLQPIRNHFGPIRISSGYRSPKLNKDVGGSEKSNHCRGEAADIEPFNAYQIPLFEMLEWIYNNLQFRNLILEYPPNGWVHIDYRGGANIRRLKLKDNTHNYIKVTINYLRHLYG